jgi:hypothetical protein
MSSRRHPLYASGEMGTDFIFSRERGIQLLSSLKSLSILPCAALNPRQPNRAGDHIMQDPACLQRWSGTLLKMVEGEWDSWKKMGTDLIFPEDSG